VRDGCAGAVVVNGGVASGQDFVVPSLEDHLLRILAAAAALGDQRDWRSGAFDPDRQVRELLGVSAIAARRDRPRLALDGKLARRFQVRSL
jgi:hypothetical protein